MNKIINGKLLSENILKQVRQEVLKKDKQIGLAAILVGDDASSHLYVKLKKYACDDCDIIFNKYLFDKDHSTEDIVKTIEFLNKDEEVQGILVQLPLPGQYDTEKIIQAIDPKKDIDGFHPENIKKLEQCQLNVVSPLVLGIVELIKSTSEEIKDKNIVILCNNKIFGKPFNCFYGKDNQIHVVTLEDKDWKEKVKLADVLVVSIGRAKFIRKEMIKNDCIIIDVGINKIGKSILGDVDLEEVLEKVKFITPVPGGVGPMTVAMLLKNLLKLS